MEKDKDYLLSMEHPSDSDEIEEFKLPPTRTRRPRTKKALAEARVAASRSTLLSWKCAFSFILISAAITGILLLSFFLLTIEHQLKELKFSMTKVEAENRRHKSLSKLVNDLSSELNKQKATVKTLQLNNKLLARQVDHLNETFKKVQDGSTVSMVHRIDTVANDVTALKDGMAQTGGDIGRLKDNINNYKSQFNRLDEEMTVLKTSFNNMTKQIDKLDGTVSILAMPSAKNMVSGESVSKQDLATVVLNLKQSSEDARVKVKTVFMMELSKLDSFIDSVNTTHNADLLRLVKGVNAIKNKSDTHLGLFEHEYYPNLQKLNNLTSSLQSELKEISSWTKKEITKQKAALKNMTMQLIILSEKLNQSREYDLKSNRHSSDATVVDIHTAVKTDASGKPVTNPISEQKVDSTASNIATTSAPAEIVSQAPEVNNVIVNPRVTMSEIGHHNLTTSSDAINVSKSDINGTSVPMHVAMATVLNTTVSPLNATESTLANNHTNEKFKNMTFNTTQQTLLSTVAMANDNQDATMLSAQLPYIPPEAPNENGYTLPTDSHTFGPNPPREVKEQTTRNEGTKDYNFESVKAPIDESTGTVPEDVLQGRGIDKQKLRQFLKKLQESGGDQLDDEANKANSLRRRVFNDNFLEDDDLNDI